MTTPQQPSCSTAAQLRAEFKQLHSETLKLNETLTTEECRKPHNRQKNRYGDVLCIDETRVRLCTTTFASSTPSTSCFSAFATTPTPTPPTSDYIHANWVSNGFQLPRISTQAPLPETMVDFWLMIWQQRSNIVVMLSALVERHRLKCHQYWPSCEGQTTQFGNLLLTWRSTQQIATHTILRVFVLQSADPHSCDQPRVIHHLQFIGWPDMGCPDMNNFLQMLWLVRAMEKEAADNSPLVVHCSAGIGRTGVFLAVDSLLQQLEHGLPVSVPSTVLCLRKQRYGLVQTPAQYEFIYSALTTLAHTFHSHQTTAQQQPSTTEPIHHHNNHASGRKQLHQSCPTLPSLFSVSKQHQHQQQIMSPMIHQRSHGQCATAGAKFGHSFRDLRSFRDLSISSC